MYLKINKIFLTYLLTLFFCNISFAESFYFKNCLLNERVSADYLIDVENKIINVTLTSDDGKTQNFSDEIKSIEKDKIVSAKIKSGRSEDAYFIYYLDNRTNSVTKQNYKIERSINFVSPDGPRIESFCSDVKADWDDVQRRKKQKKEAEIRKKKEAEIKKKKEEQMRKAAEKEEEERNNINVSVIGEKWIKFKDYNSNAGKQLKIDFDKKAAEDCLALGFNNFDILEKVFKIIEIDETPAFGLEPKVKVGVVGAVKCK